MGAPNTTMDWDKLKVFHAAAEAGSFTHAGERLGLSQSAVSRQVSALEAELSVSLFHRHARGLILTEQGELLYRTAHEVFMKLEAARTIAPGIADAIRAEGLEGAAARYGLQVQQTDWFTRLNNIPGLGKRGRRNADGDHRRHNRGM